MYIQHFVGLIHHPKEEWEEIVEEKYSIVQCYLRYIMWLAAIPAVSVYIGTTQVGWSLGGRGDTVLLTEASALPIAISFYFVLLGAVGAMAYAMYWMEHTYGVDASLERCFMLTTFTATPMMLAGLAGLYPVMWFDVMVGLAAITYTLKLLITGVPILGHISEERGFMFSMSVVTVGLCVLVAVLAITVILWSSITPPVFIR
ncbi:Yip1 family protein [Marinomonas sp. MED121]|uniref:Yip1 family protein n=1 Tax=Marinomonas sp. MED121 TaxID=314277 RepID=UPI0005682574|nr:Yip1 family protein [Marinomonas sp. MED121]